MNLGLNGHNLTGIYNLTSTFHSGNILHARSALTPRKDTSNGGWDRMGPIFLRVKLFRLLLSSMCFIILKKERITLLSKWQGPPSHLGRTRDPVYLRLGYALEHATRRRHPCAVDLMPGTSLFAKQRAKLVAQHEPGLVKTRSKKKRKSMWVGVYLQNRLEGRVPKYCRRFPFCCYLKFYFRLNFYVFLSLDDTS